MLMAVGLVGAGFVAGVVLTGLVAASIIGFLHAEAARALDSYGVMLFASAPKAIASVAGDAGA